MKLTLSLFLSLLVLSSVAFAADGGETVDMVNGTSQAGPTPVTGSGCNMQGFKDALAGRESSGNCAARRPGSQFLGKYQLGKKTALADIRYTDANGNWINGMSDQMFLSSCDIQEKAMDAWIAHMAGGINGATTANGTPLTSYLTQPIPACPDKKLTFSGLLGGRHLCGLGYKGDRANSGTCFKSGYTGLIAYFESGGAKDGKDGLGTRISEYICKFNGYQTPHDNGGDFSSCGGGASYGGSPGAGKEGFDPQGYYGENYDPNPNVRMQNILNDAINTVWIAGLQLMAEQLTVSMMKQAEIIGTFFDAKHQLETQRLFQQKTAQAHKDYHPSEQMCTIGTFARNLSDTERRADLTQMALAQRGVQREMMGGDTITVGGGKSDMISRFATWQENFCNSKDNAHGNKDLCVGDIKDHMINRDIDYTRTVDIPLTLAIDPLKEEVSEDELAAFALMDNLFQHKAPIVISKEKTLMGNFPLAYQNLRSVMAMRAVARNSFNHILSQKGEGPALDGDAKGMNTPYLRALIKEMGITGEDDITAMLGERPSYWAQMEVLTKKLYQHPNFTVNLYDKPANVTRMRTAMRAIKSMQDSDIQEALIRREMLLSILAEIRVRQEQGRVNNLIRDLNASE